jgi:hypothetical protein
MPWVGRLVLVGLLSVAACSGDGGPSRPANSSSAPSAAASSSTKPGATAQLAFEGDNGLAGAATNASVRCGFPDLEGPSVAVLAQAPDSSVQFRIAITAGKVTVRLGSGSGADYHERAFEGPGVNGFDSRKGGQIDASLTPTTSTSGTTTAGTIGAVTSLKGSVDCAGQDPGSSTITVTGDTAEGLLNAARLEQVRAECFHPGDEVVVLGILNVGSTKAFVEYGLRPDGIDVRETMPSGLEHHYVSAAPATLSGNGAFASGDAVEQNATTPHTLHVEGGAVCGTPVN